MENTPNVQTGQESSKQQPVNPRSLTVEQLEQMGIGGEAKKPEEKTEEPKAETKEKTEPADETKEEGQQAEPTEDAEEEIPGFFVKEGDKYSEVKWDDVQFPLKYKGKMLDKSYHEVINLAQLGLDSEKRYQEVRKVKEENDYYRNNFKALVQQEAHQQAKQIFEAWAEELSQGNEADDTTKASRARERLLEQKQKELQDRLDRFEEERTRGSEKEQLRRNSEQIHQIKDEVVSGFKDRFKVEGKMDNESFSTFEDLVATDIRRKVLEVTNREGRTIDWDEYREIVEESAKNRLKFFTTKIAKPSKPNPPKAPSISGSNGSTAPGLQKIDNKKLLTTRGLKSLSLEEIERLGR